MTLQPGNCPATNWELIVINPVTDQEACSMEPEFLVWLEHGPHIFEEDTGSKFCLQCDYDDRPLTKSLDKRRIRSL